MKKLLLILIFTTCLVKAQNLVPNPGFTNYTTCPTSQNQLNYAYPWYNPSVSTPDFFHQCSGAIPNGGPLYYQYDHTGGGGVAGVAAFASSTPNSREYLQVELIDTLRSVSKYCIEFYASLIENAGMAVSDLGVYFSDSAMFLTFNTNFPVAPQIENPDTVMLNDYINWMKVSGIYTAVGGEKFITIGNFRDDNSLHSVVTNANNSQYAYYLIDDVLVLNCDSLFIGVDEKNLSNSRIKLYPNPASALLTIETNEDGVLAINTVGGKEVMLQSCRKGKSTVSIDELLPGIYIYKYITESGQLNGKLIVVN